MTAEPAGREAWGVAAPVGATGAAPTVERSALLVVTPADLLRAIKLANHARARNEARPVLTYFHFHPVVTGGYAIATADNYRVGRCLLPTTDPSEGSISFNLRAETVGLMVSVLKLLHKTLLKLPVMLRVELDPFDPRSPEATDGSWTFEVPCLPMTLTGRLAYGRYPDYSQVLDQRRTDERAVTLNPRYLAEAAKAITDAGEISVRVTLGGALEPVRLKSETFETVLMPVRTPDRSEP